jgi:hypothetical protein
MSHPVISPVFAIGIVSRSAHSSTISSWSDGVRLSLSIAQESRGPISSVVNVRSIMVPLFFLGLVVAPGSSLSVFPGLVIAPGSLFRISP